MAALPRILRWVAACAVAVWLFSDTVRHYAPNHRDPHVIRFAHFGTYQDYETWQRVITAFEAKHPGSRVVQEYVVGWYGLYDTKLRQQMLAGALPHVALVQPGPFAAVAERFADLTPRIDDARGGMDLDELDAVGVGMFRFDGRQRALPVSGGNLLIYCNPECFERAAEHRGYPVPLPADDWTMEDFRRVAIELTCDFDGDGAIDQFGFWQPRWVYYLPFIWSFGAELTDDAGRSWEFTGPTAEAALAFYRDMRVGPRRYAPHPDEVSQIVQDVGFLTGKTAMCINGPWFQPFLAETKLATSFAVLPIPTGPGGRYTRVTWDGIALAPQLSADEADTAWRFIRFVCSAPAQRILARTQRALPARRGALAVFDRNGSDPRARRFVEALAYSRTEPRSPAFIQIDRAVNRALRELVKPGSGATPAGCLERIAAKVQPLLETSADD